MKEPLHCPITAACTTPPRDTQHRRSSSHYQHRLYDYVHLVCIALLIMGCAPRPTPICEANKSVRIFRATEIDHYWVNLVWVEIPLPASEGTFPGRLFIASKNPIGAIVPSMIELPFVVSSPEDTDDFTPAPVEIEFQEGGRFLTAYTWMSCPTCEECYMTWSYILTLHGHITETSLDAEITLIHFSQLQPAKVLC